MGILSLFRIVLILDALPVLSVNTHPVGGGNAPWNLLSVLQRREVFTAQALLQVRALPSPSPCQRLMPPKFSSDRAGMAPAGEAETEAEEPQPGAGQGWHPS